jgi:hypothetical protein
MSQRMMMIGIGMPISQSNSERMEIPLLVPDDERGERKKVPRAAVAEA